jgi:hypothetical protein
MIYFVDLHFSIQNLFYETIDRIFDNSDVFYVSNSFIGNFLNSNEFPAENFIVLNNFLLNFYCFKEFFCYKILFFAIFFRLKLFLP